MTYRRTGHPRGAQRRTFSMAVGWVVAVTMIALVVGAGAGTLLTAVLIAAGRGQREGADTACPACSSPVDRATGSSARRSAQAADREPPPTPDATAAPLRAPERP